MADSIRIQKGRTVSFEFTLGHPIGDDTYTSEIREQARESSELIATWNITVKPGGNNRVLIFTLDDSVSREVIQKYGWMDLKRVSGGEPLPVLDSPILVEFREVVTA